MTAERKRADISDDGPTVLRRYARGIGIHRTISVGDHVKEVLIVGAAQALVMIAGRPRHATLNDDAVAVATGAMTRLTKDAEPLLAAFEQRGRHGRLPRGGLIARKIIACNHADRRRAQHAAAKRWRSGIFAVFGLDIHVLIACGKRHRGKQQERRLPCHRGTHSTEAAPSCCRKPVVSSLLNLLSSALTHRKKRSLLARRKFGAANSGWFSRGNPFCHNIAAIIDSADKRIGSSNMPTEREKKE